MVKIKRGSIIKDVTKESVKYFQMAGYEIVKEKKGKENDKSDTKEVTTSSDNTTEV